MEVKPIKNNSDYEKMLEIVDDLFDKKVTVNSPDGEKLQAMLLLIKEYEDKHFPIFDVHQSGTKL
jgi:HTH-type transcriptional regulator / antitoxin HigA